MNGAMEQPDRIFLRDHVLSAEIGAFQSERGRDQRLRFSLTVDLRDPVSGAGDRVDAILSYDVLTRAVDTALADRRYDLVETLAERIAAEVLAHPRAARIAVTVEKLDRGPGALGVSIMRDSGRVAATGADSPFHILLDGAQAAKGAAVILPPAAPAEARGPHARRIALLALDQAAWALAGDRGLEVAATWTEIEAAALTGQAVVWAPALLAGDHPDAGLAPADLARWLAGRMRGARLAEPGA